MFVGGSEPFVAGYFACSLVKTEAILLRPHVSSDEVSCRLDYHQK